jgi:hypothetical protein
MKDELIHTSKSACAGSREPSSDSSSPMTGSKAPTGGLGWIARKNKDSNT